MNSLRLRILAILRIIRAPIMRILRPKHAYFFASSPIRDLEPLSSKFGFDRGTPINRYYIEHFLEQHADAIHGTCLEIHDAAYTRRFGGKRITHSDVLDIDSSNKEATVYADLRSMPHVPSNTYDCIILTHTLGMIDDCAAAVGECYRILKPGGSLLITSAALGPLVEQQPSFWRFTESSMRYILAKHFSNTAIQVESFGNVLVGQYVLTGLAQEELTTKELTYNDKRFPVVIAAVARK